MRTTFKQRYSQRFGAAFNKAFTASDRAAEAGFSLLLVLFFVTIVGTVFGSLIYYQSTNAVDRNARAAGWHLVEVSKAARIFVRDRSLAGASAVLFSNAGQTCCSQADVEAAGGSIEITVGDLINANHLPANFPARNPLGQDLEIFVASYPPSATPLAGNLPIASYVIATAGGGRAAAISNARTSAGLTEGAREAGMSVSSPVFNAANNVAGDTCAGTGQPAVVIWDTGCLTQADVNIITASAGGIAVTPGLLMVPTWRAVDHDLRAMMRFPQPENPTANTMLTDILLGEPGVVVAGVETYTDDTVGADNRVNITNVGAMTLSALTASPQAQDFGGDDLGDFATEVMNVTGNMNVAGDLTVTTLGGAGPAEVVFVNNGQIQAVGAGTTVTATDVNVTGALDFEDNTPNLTLNTSNLIGTTVTAIDDFSTNTIADTAGGAGFVPQVDMDSGTYITSTITALDRVESDGRVRVFNELDATGAVISASGGAPYTGIPDPSGVVGTNLSARFGLLSGVNVSSGGVAVFQQGGTLNSASNIVLDGLHTDNCSGQCPDETNNDPIDPTPP